MTTPAALALPRLATEAELLALPEQGRGYELIDELPVGVLFGDDDDEPQSA